MNKLISGIIASCGIIAAPLAHACEPMHRGPGAATYFEEMDTNKDGAISKKEFDAFHDKHFKEVDANHDGKITREEMQAAHPGMHAHGGKHGDMRGDAFIGRRFEAADTNHDGALTKEEAKDMPMLSQHFDEIDTNKDGKVTPDEVKAMMQGPHPESENNNAPMPEKK